MATRPHPTPLLQQRSRAMLAPLLVGLAAADAPPFTFNIDQSVPCPAGSADYSIAAPLADAEAPQLQAALAPVAAMLRTKLTELRSPSTGVIVTQGGRVIFESFQGSAKLDSQAPLTSATGIKIASITKTFTSTMLFKLRDDGKLGPLGLDTPVSHLLPEFSIQSPYPSGRGITLRALAMHVSGLPREEPEGATEAEILEGISRMTVLSPQFAQAHYSNLGIALLGRALQRAANTTWEDYLATEILAPLGMADSGNPPWPAAVLGRMAEGVNGEGELINLRLPEYNRTSWASPCGSMHSSPRDMVRWMNFHMDVGTDEEKAAFAKVLDPATRTEMHSTGFALGDGLAGVSSAVFETAYIHGRRTANKLGNDAGCEPTSPRPRGGSCVWTVACFRLTSVCCVCTDRTSMTMVPDLALGIFAFATSTGDLWGDGDAVGFPVASRLIPVVDELLTAQDLRGQRLPNASFVAAISGLYCTSNRTSALARTIAVENIPVPSAAGDRLVGVPTLVLREGAGSPSKASRTVLADPLAASRP